MWDIYRLSPDTMWVNSQEALSISRKILTGNASSAYKYEISVTRDQLGGGFMARTYLNASRWRAARPSTSKCTRTCGGDDPVHHRHLPYPINNVGNVMQVRTRQDYYQIEWPLRSRKYEYGVYADEVLQHYFPPSLAVITNIANG